LELQIQQQMLAQLMLLETNVLAAPLQQQALQQVDYQAVFKHFIN
jgi:hypothetical protein